MSSLRSDCRKFAPNIFNKTKCSNCFKQREEHSAEALESNRHTPLFNLYVSLPPEKPRLIRVLI
ncbi:hypothetical protein B566_EDAN009634 [Ephemera danica]|nr:hypothetical protein B566_EDAN009634 [Ephemera danica]